jgi:hypothetical protein
MALVERAHRRHQRHRSVDSQSRNRTAQWIKPIDGLHASLSLQ